MLFIALPALQLIPLPPMLWQALPGRELQQEALALIDLDQTWRPISLAPQRTLASLLSLMPPLAMLVMTVTLDQPSRFRLVMVALVAGVASLVLGALQVTGGETSWSHLYDETRPVVTGFQANRNSTADFLLVAMLGVPMLVRSLVDRHRLPGNRLLVLGLTAGGLATFALGVALTGSRSGIMLLPIPLVASLWLLRSWLPVERRYALTGLAVLGTMGVLALLLARNSPVLVAVLQRFDFSNELRPQIWRDALYVAQAHFPVGVGMGNFTPALVTSEQLAAVRPFLPNRAHNDYLELVVEAGAAGIAAFSAASWLVLREGWRAWHDPARGGAGLVVFATCGLTVLALHSVVDYPLRSMSMACLGGVCAALLMTPRVATGSGEGE
jgi:exopolysaccharide production protein ExoQ